MNVSSSDSVDSSGGRVVELLREVDPPADPFDRLAAVRSRARRDDQRRLSWVGAGLAAVLVAGIAGVFTVDRQSDAIRLVDVATATEEAGSYRMVAEVSFDGLSGFGGAQGGASFVVRADVDVVNDRSVSRTEVRGLGGSGSGSAVAAIASGGQEVRQIGKDVWTKTETGSAFAGLPSSADFPILAKLRDRPWLHVTRGADDRLQAFGAFDPGSLLKGLAAGKRVRDLPRGEVGGDAVDRFVVLVDERSFALAQGRSAVGESSTPLEVTAAVDARGRLRQLAVQSDAVGVQGQGGSSPAVNAVVTFTDFGLKVDVRPPAAGEVQELSGLFGTGGSGSFGGAYSSELEITMDSESSGSTGSGTGSGPGADACALVPLIESQRAELDKDGKQSPARERAMDAFLAEITEDCAAQKAGTAK